MKLIKRFTATRVHVAPALLRKDQKEKCHAHTRFCVARGVAIDRYVQQLPSKRA